MTPMRSGMGRWRVIASALLVLSVLLLAWGVVTHQSRKEQARRRAAAYEATLREYSAVLKRGMTRKTVEDYLRKQNAGFTHSCCMGASHNAWDTLVKIDEEKPPWFCSEQYVYVGFEFVSDAPHRFPEAHDSDTLTVVRLLRRSTGCL